jgi:hypothetical protein
MAGWLVRWSLRTYIAQLAPIEPCFQFLDGHPRCVPDLPAFSRMLNMNKHLRPTDLGTK